MYRIVTRLIAPSQFSLDAIQSNRHFHVSSPNCFYFVKRQVTVDPELAKLREDRKRRKLEKAITVLKKFSKKPRPVEEIQIGIKIRKTIGARVRKQTEVTEEERQRRVILLKEYARSRSRLAKHEHNLIHQTVERQKQALTLLKHLSSQLYEAAIQPDKNLLPIMIDGPSLTPPIADYKSPDGDFADITKKWVQPVLPLLNKRFGIGKLIKTPTFKKNQEQQPNASTVDKEMEKPKMEKKDEPTKKQEPTKEEKKPEPKKKLKTETA